MNIKIDGQSHPAGTEAPRRLDPSKQPERAPATGSRAADSDTVEVSSDAKLVAAVLKAVDESPSVRADVVERAKRALENGAVGDDAGRLADRIITSLLGN